MQNASCPRFLTGWHEVCPAPPVEAYDLILDVLVRPAGFGRRKAPLVGPVQPQRLRRDADYGRVEIQMQHMIAFPTRTRTPRGRLWWLTTTDPLRCRCPFRDVNRRTGKLRSAASPTPARAASGA